MPPQSSGTTNQQTSFITGLAWSFIGLGGVTLLLAVIQYVLAARVLPMEIMREMLFDAIKLNLLPPSVMTVFENMRGIAVALAAASLLMLLISIGLLRRQNWARLAFTWMMIAAAAVHIAGAFFPLYLLRDFSLAADAIPPELQGIAAFLKNFITVSSIAMSIVFAGAFGWLAKRMLSSDVKREFVR